MIETNNEMPERIWAGHNGRHSTICLLKKPILNIPADVEYIRADLVHKKVLEIEDTTPVMLESITEHPDVQRLIVQIHKLQQVKELVYEKLDTRSHKGHKHYHGGCLFCEIEQTLEEKKG